MKDFYEEQTKAIIMINDSWIILPEEVSSMMMNDGNVIVEWWCTIIDIDHGDDDHGGDGNEALITMIVVMNVGKCYLNDEDDIDDDHHLRDSEAPNPGWSFPWVHSGSAGQNV